MKLLNTSFGLVLLMSMIGISANAHTIEVANDDGVTIYYNYINDQTELTVTYRGNSYSAYSDEYSGNVVIPSSVTYGGKTYNVRTINWHAFQDCTSLTSVTIPDGVTNIGEDAFKNTGIYNNAPNGIYYVDGWACGYKGDKPSGEFVLAQNTRGIGDNLFYQCTGLTSVTIPESVTSIGNSAFYGCSGLTSVVIPNSVISIDRYVFSGCTGLTSVVMGNSVTSVGNGAFKNCSNLNKVIVSDIAAWCNISFEDSYSNPLSYAHHLYSDENTEITDLVIPEGVTSIGKYAFNYCSDLTSVTIPNSVTSIGSSAFAGCTGLQRVNISDLEAWCDIDFDGEDSNPLSKAHDLYLNGVKIDDLVVPNSIENLKKYVFAGGHFSSVSIPNTTNLKWYDGIGQFERAVIGSITIVQNISDAAFWYATIDHLVIDPSVTYGGYQSFYGARIGRLEIPYSETTLTYSNGKNSYGFIENAKIDVAVVDRIMYSSYYGGKMPPFYLSKITNLYVGSHISSDAYNECNLVNVVTEEATPVAISANTFSKRSSAILYVPAGSKSAYQSATYWQDFKEIIEIPSSTPAITFADANVKAICVANWDFNDDGELNEGEAAVVVNLNSAFSQKTEIVSFDEFRYFTGLQTFDSFWNCTNLQSITIPKTITYFLNSGNMFNGCVNLSSLKVDEDNTVYDSRNNCNAIIKTETNILVTGCKGTIIPNNVSEIGYRAFYRSGLTSVTIPSSVTSIGSGAFDECGSLTSVTVDMATPLVIGENVFSNRANATLYVPYGSSAAYAAADYWKDFKEIIELPAPSPAIVFADANAKALCVANWDTNGDGELSEAEAAAVTDLGEVFKENTEIASFDELAYFTGLTSIGDNAFNGCNGLTSVTFPNSLTGIGSTAFENCTGLTSVTIPNSVTNIGTNPFKKCSGLIAIVVEKGNVNYDSRNDCNAIIETATNILVSGCKNTIIPEGITTIGGWAFSFCTDLTSMTIPDGVTDIQIAAFENCYALTSLAIPQGVTNIGGWAFSYCNNLPSVNIPNSVTNIGILAFNNCHSLTSIVIPNSVTYLGEAVFQDCNNLTTVNVDIDNPLTIDANTFSNRNNATLYVPYGCSEAYEGAAYWNEFMEIVEMPAPWADIEEDIYCLKNVETGKYLNAGNAWGTHAVLADEPLPARISKQPDGCYTIFFPVGSQEQQLLFRDSMEGVYVDYQGQESGCPYWTITDIGNGNYHIQSLTTHETYGQEAMPGTYLGNDPDKEAANQDGYALGVYNDVDGNVTEGKNITWTLEPLPARTEAQVSQLQELVTTAQGLGLDTSEAEAALNNDETPYLDMMQAIIDLQQRINDKIEVNKKLSDLTMLIACSNAVGVNTDEAQAVADSPSSMDAVTNAIITLREAYIAKLGEGVSSSLLPLNVTGVILNPSFVIDNADGWSCDDETPQFQSYNNAEYYQKTFDIHQTVSGLPNGNYVLKVKGFHRPGSNQDVFSSYMNGENLASAQLYANSSNVIMENQARYAQENQNMGGASVTNDEETYFVPNSMSEARDWFDAGYYENELPFTVTDGTLTLGIRLEESVDDGWVIFDDFRLEYVVAVTDITQMDNVIYIEPTEKRAGAETTISFNMKNTAVIRGFQFDLELPEGVTPVEDGGEYVYWLNADRAPKKAGGQFYHNLEVTRQADGSYRFLCGSQTDKTFIGNDGEVAVMKVNIADDMQEGDYPIILRNVKLSETDISVYYLTDEVATNLTILSYIPGDINSDGIVDVSDYIGVANHILGNTPAGFNSRAADVNEDNVIDVSDYIGVANIILTGSIYGNANARTSNRPKQIEQEQEPQ